MNDEKKLSVRNIIRNVLKKRMPEGYTHKQLDREYRETINTIKVLIAGILIFTAIFGSIYSESF